MCVPGDWNASIGSSLENHTLSSVLIWFCIVDKLKKWSIPIEDLFEMTRSMNDIIRHCRNNRTCEQFCIGNVYGQIFNLGHSVADEIVEVSKHNVRQALGIPFHRKLMQSVFFLEGLISACSYSFWRRLNYLIYAVTIFNFFLNYLLVQLQFQFFRII